MIIIVLLTKRTLYTYLHTANSGAAFFVHSQLLMRKIVLCLFFSFFFIRAFAVLVTFQVDMSQMVISANGVHLAGDFQGWDPASTLMTDLGGGIYAITLDIPPGSYQFKFVNGDAWGTDEIVPIACGIDDGGGIYNRPLTVASDMVLPAICFGQCNLCEPASFVMNGNATALGGDCYQVTPGVAWQNGAFWSNTQIDLNASFDLQFTMNLGVNDSTGADGVVFVLQRLGSGVIGASGGGMGYSSFGTSLGIEFDTFQNPEFNDPMFDHISIELNGEVNHYTPENIGVPVQMASLNPNTEDGVDHIVGIQWDATTQTISVYFDCELRIQASHDLVNNVFGGMNNVFWGFTGATGALFNQQTICAIPNAMQTDAVDICPGSSTVISAGASIDGIYSWTPASYLSGASSATPTATPPLTTIYQVTYKDLCNVTRVKEVTVNVLSSGPPCFLLPVRLDGFKVNASEKLLDFTWRTLSEEQNNFFTIEHSDDAKNFQPLLNITGSGNSMMPTSYHATSFRSDSDKYYRLAQTDYNGKKEIISTIRFVESGSSSQFIIRYDAYQQGYLVVGNFPNGKSQIDVYAMTGQRVFQATSTGTIGAVFITPDVHNAIGVIVITNESGDILYREKLLLR